MSEMNGNEEYYLMSGRFLPHSQRPGTIHAGDRVLQGSDCLLVFYETFSAVTTIPGSAAWITPPVLPPWDMAEWK